MSYHRAKVLPQVQPARRFANAQTVWARQLQYAIPRPPQAVPAGRAVLGSMNYYYPPFAGLGSSGDGLGAALVVI